MAAFATVGQFLARFDQAYVEQLVGRPPPGETPEEKQLRIETRVQAALDDATEELQGHIDRIAANRRPAAGTKRVHCVKVATYLLTLDRPGKEFEQIRNAYTDTIKFYTDLLPTDNSQAQSPIEVSACAPDPVFTNRGFRGYDK